MAGLLSHGRMRPNLPLLSLMFIASLATSSCVSGVSGGSLTPEQKLKRLLEPHTILYPITSDVIEAAGNPRVRDNRSRRIFFGDNDWRCSFVYTSDNDKVMVCE